MKADPGMPTGGPVRLTVEELHDLVDVLYAADAVTVAAFGLEDLALEPDPFAVERGWASAVERCVRELWVYLALYDVDVGDEKSSGSTE